MLGTWWRASRRGRGEGTAGQSSVVLNSVRACVRCVWSAHEKRGPHPGTTGGGLDLPPDSWLPSCVCTSLPQSLIAEAGTETQWILAYINVDPSLLDDTVERVNISLPRRILARLDAQAKAAGESRSSYIAHLAALR
ncbi:type II toxin-antitoxin system HicB family antitoxin [Stenotrophomonas sp. NPDC077659]|uniref:type II toxin-antitoxin system HicB family antitoxin n=1 Tax=Stenotrophomonas sp. NPDC077659 TaxID=3390694 RepID=UPI003CFBFF0D